MKVLFGLCLIAVVMSVGEASRTLSKCKRDHCLIKNGEMCRCGKDGKVENAQPASVCLCTPGEKFHPKWYICTCPEGGLLRPSDCVRAPRRSAARKRASHSADIFRRFTSSDPPIPPNCGYYEIVGNYIAWSYGGRTLFWLPQHSCGIVDYWFQERVVNKLN